MCHTDIVVCLFVYVLFTDRILQSVWYDRLVYISVGLTTVKAIYILGTYTAWFIRNSEVDNFTVAIPNYEIGRYIAE